MLACAVCQEAGERQICLDNFCQAVLACFKIPFLRLLLTVGNRDFMRRPSSPHKHQEGLGCFWCVLLLFTFAPTLSIAQRTVSDLDGKNVNLIASKSGKIVVLIFLRRDCPLSARYAPTIQHISSEHAKKVRFFLIFPDKSDSGSEIRQYLRDFHYSIPALRDPGHILVRQAHARITPEAAVFAGGSLVYHGRIDDLYESFGHARSAPTTHELEDSIGAALNGRSPSVAEAPSVGCYISDLD